jgi:UDP-2,4-diacetamido-2,4,6-trideoxy-beta-L-altropyranose hydrolase
MNQPIIAFRADASFDIGTGHVMRCLTLADTLRDRGAKCYFVCRAHEGNLLDTIDRRGYVAQALPCSGVQLAIGRPRGECKSKYAAWLGADWETDVDQTITALGCSPVDWMIVDHYAIDARWERRLRPYARHIMVIDDLADRSHDCDLLLDQNLGRSVSDYDNWVDKDCTVLVGPKYALLRPEFAKWRSYSLARRGRLELKQLLVSMGGVDKDNVTSDVLVALKDCRLPLDCRITVVLGAHAPWKEQISCIAKQLPWVTEVLFDVTDMAKLLASSDVAIGAAGSSSWERCCLGIPSLIVVLADNQQLIAEALDAAGVAGIVNLKTLAADMEKLLSGSFTVDAFLVSAGASSACVTDGKGAIRVSESIFAGSHA